MSEVEVFPGIELHNRAWIGLTSLRPESRKKVDIAIQSLSSEEVRSKAQFLGKSTESDTLFMIQATNNGDQYDIFFTVTPENKIVVLDLSTTGRICNLFRAVSEWLRFDEGL